MDCRNFTRRVIENKTGPLRMGPNKYRTYGPAEPPNKNITNRFFITTKVIPRPWRRRKGRGKRDNRGPLNEVRFFPARSPRRSKNRKNETRINEINRFVFPSVNTEDCLLLEITY